MCVWSSRATVGTHSNKCTTYAYYSPDKAGARSQQRTSCFGHMQVPDLCGRAKVPNLKDDTVTKLYNGVFGMHWNSTLQALSQISNARLDNNPLQGLLR